MVNIGSTDNLYHQYYNWDNLLELQEFQFKLFQGFHSNFLCI